MVHKFLYCLSLIFLPSCTLIANTTPAHGQFKDLLKQNLVLLPDNKFENLPPSLKENEIIFLGEEHNIGPLIQAASSLAVHFAAYKPVVYASEGCYGLSPFMEAASLGNPKTAIFKGCGSKPVQIPACIQSFNSNQTADRKILMTAIDLEHSIYHNKSDTALFLQDLASRSTSDIASQAINKEVAMLTAQNTCDKMDNYLKGLKKMFLQHFDTFSSEDRDEILFSMELLTASNRYQYRRIEIDRSTKHDYVSLNKFRTIYFIKTIERAYQKARKNNAILLCRVGSYHISSAYKCEARYFAKNCPLTKGKVTTIRMIPLYYNIHDTNDAAGEQDDMDTIVKTLMKDNEYSYLSLADLPKNTNVFFKQSRYYSRGKPQYDGLLFVKIKTPELKAN